MTRIRPLRNRILLTNLERGEKTTKGGIIIQMIVKSQPANVVLGHVGLRYMQWDLKMMMLKLGIGY